MEKPDLKCEQCTKSFNRPAKLHAHVKVKHQNLRYPCAKCYRTYASWLWKTQTWNYMLWNPDSPPKLWMLNMCEALCHKSWTYGGASNTTTFPPLVYQIDRWFRLRKRLQVKNLVKIPTTQPFSDLIFAVVTKNSKTKETSIYTGCVRIIK